MNKPLTALVVDDNRQVCQVIAAILEAEGIRVLLASNSGDGLEYVKHHAIDVLFADLRLPGEDGLTVIRKSLQVRPDIAAVLFTGAGTLDSAVEALRLGACDYVTKPIDREKIRTALKRSLGLRTLAQTSGHDDATEPARSNGNEVVFVCGSSIMRDIVARAEKVASWNVPVLMLGESGVGKNLLARMIHSHSKQAGGSFSYIAGAAIPETPSGSAWNGYPHSSVSASEENGRFPGRSGGCTLYLDNVDRIPMWAQFQLLEMLDGNDLSSCSNSAFPFRTVRVIASTTADLDSAVSEGRFLRALYDQLNVAPIAIPPLRARRDDIKALAIHFLEQFGKAQNGDQAQLRRRITDELWDMMHDYDWPGNVRELSTTLARALLLDDGTQFTTTLQTHLQTSRRPKRGEMISIPMVGDLKVMERHMIHEVIKRHGGNKAAAARALGMHRRTLYRVLEHGVPKPNSRNLLGETTASQRESEAGMVSG